MNQNVFNKSLSHEQALRHSQHVFGATTTIKWGISHLKESCLEPLGPQHT